MSEQNPQAMIWLNGILCAAASARIDPSDRGLLLGDGVFETLLVEAGTPRQLSRHYARLTAGAAVLRLALPLDEAAFGAALTETAQANQVIHGALRLTLTRGPGLRGIMPSAGMPATIMITAAKQAPIPALGAPVRVVIARDSQRDAASPLSRIKSLNYLANILARFEANDRDAEDAILLNHLGFVAEASAANLFLYSQGAWFTPPVADGALPGIRRQILIEAGLVVEARLSRNDLFAADALCLGNVLGVRVISHLDGRALAGDSEACARLALAGA